MKILKTMNEVFWKTLSPPIGFFSVAFTLSFSLMGWFVYHDFFKAIAVAVISFLMAVFSLGLVWMLIPDDDNE